VRSYAYAGDDPLDATDPSGLLGICVGGWSIGDCSTNPDPAQIAGGVSLLVGAGAILAAAVVGDAFFPPSAGGNPAEGVTAAGMFTAGLTLVRTGLAVSRVARLGLAVSGASVGLGGARVLMSSPGGSSGPSPGDVGGGGSASEPSSRVDGNASQADLLAQARAARDARAAEVGRSKAAVTGGYNMKTGEVVAGCSGNEMCAEDDVVQQLGGNPSEVRFTEAVRPRTGNQQPICERCQGKYTRDQFPPDVLFKPEGPWSE